MLALLSNATSVSASPVIATGSLYAFSLYTPFAVSYIITVEFEMRSFAVRSVIIAFDDNSISPVPFTFRTILPVLLYDILASGPDIFSVTLLLPLPL